MLPDRDSRLAQARAASARRNASPRLPLEILLAVAEAVWDDVGWDADECYGDEAALQTFAALSCASREMSELCASCR